jgi:hypothetical protein
MSEFQSGRQHINAACQRVSEEETIRDVKTELPLNLNATPWGRITNMRMKLRSYQAPEQKKKLWRAEINLEPPSRWIAKECSRSLSQADSRQSWQNFTVIIAENQSIIICRLKNSILQNGKQIVQAGASMMPRGCVFRSAHVVMYVFCCCIFMYVPFSVFCALFVCKCELYYCHRVSTQLRSNILYHIISFSTVRSESRCALRLRYVDLVVSIEDAVEVWCSFTVFSC